jgi:hypothetical protein
MADGPKARARASAFESQSVNIRVRPPALDLFSLYRGCLDGQKDAVRSSDYPLSAIRYPLPS